MTELLETCETCGKEKSATYTQFGVGVLGAALCPKCQKIARNPAFKTELAHILATGNGDLDKFFKSNQVIIPLCNTCGDDLKASNWAESDQKGNRHICITCRKAKNKASYQKSRAARQAKKIIHHNVNGIPLPMVNEAIGARPTLFCASQNEPSPFVDGTEGKP